MIPPRVERLADGREVRTLALGAPGGLQLEVMDYGATLRRLTAPAAIGPIDVTPAYPDLEGYVQGQAYLNAAIGRFANRLDHGRFTLDGQAFQVSVNEPPNTLHGGVEGFNRRIWRIVDHGPDHAMFAYASPDGEEGFPGRLEATVAFTVSGDALTLDYAATADRPTPVNLTHHLYFNLSGRPDATILDHTLRIAGAAVTEVRADLIPTGRLRPVAGSPFDFRTNRRIGEAVAAADPLIAVAKGVDLNWALDPGAGVKVELHSPESGLTLELATDQPGMQVYSGQHLQAPFVRHGALALEPQGFPDAPNHPGFPSAILRPGRTYRHTSTYRFQG